MAILIDMSVCAITSWFKAGSILSLTLNTHNFSDMEITEPTSRQLG